MGNTESRKDLEPAFHAIATDYDAQFALDIYKQVARKSPVDVPNPLISPLSIATALAMAAAGARGKTLEEIHDCLKYSNGEGIHQFFYQIKTAIMKTGSDEDEDPDADEEDPVLSFANGLWLEKSLHLRRAFEVIVKANYGTDLIVADFRGKAEEERTIVNKWAWKVTNGRIQDLLPPGSLDPDCRMVMANTLYFKGSWDEKFYQEETIFEDFHLLDGKTVSVPFMTSRYTRYIESFENYKVLRMPYLRIHDQRSFSMFIILPDARDGLVQLEEKLDAKTLATQFNSIHKRDVGKFRLPKFRISAGFKVKDALQGLGLTAPFSEGADFSDMVVPKVEGSDKPPKADRLYLSEVFHKCFMEVNEEGTEATAGSVAVTSVPKSQTRYPPAIDFVADHPFLFFLKEERTGVILFIGRITNPSISQ